MYEFANVILMPQSPFDRLTALSEVEGREKDPCIGIKYTDSSLPPVAQNDRP